MEKVLLEATTRSESGKEYCRRLREKGFVPGVVYGGKKEVTPIEFKSADLIHILHKGGANVLINLKLPASTETVILKERQNHPFKNLLLHADFLRISLKEKLTIRVPIEIIGSAKGVQEGGILEQIMWDIEISTLPTQIPNNIPVDVTNLELGAVVYVKDLVVEKGIELKADPEAIVLSISTPKEEVEVVKEEAVAEPEVIREKKKEELE
ncbi:MAG: 50S ribosomal protein L25 [bacterium]